MESEEPSEAEARGPSVSPPAGKGSYGIDDPRTILELGIAGVLSVAVGLLISGYTSETNHTAASIALIVGPGVGFLILVVVSALYWSSRLGKPREMARIVHGVPWGGGEVVLDLGCGRGLATVRAAKYLEGGFAVGVDTWSGSRVSGNDPQSLLENARVEGVEGKVLGVKASSKQLPLADRTVDVILSGVAVHALVPKRQREALFIEMARVLKEGGRIGILDAGNGNQYSALLRRVGMRDIEMHRLRFSSFPPFHIVLARKPYGE